jgi:polyhydroxyalkanoic acid synthase PhaR subunit
MGETKEPNKGFDPFEAWRGVQESNMDAWAKAMVQAVNSEAYAKATGAILDACLSASGPLRETLEKTMTQALQQLSMPSREDFLSLAERLTNIEMRLDDMDAKLDHIERKIEKPGQTGARQKKEKK